MIPPVRVPLPPETVHLPFESGPYRMAMGLVAAPEAAWFEIDARYPAEMAERRRLLAFRRAEVSGGGPDPAAARTEARDMVLDNLTRTHSGWFARSGEIIVNRLTGERLTIAAYDPLELAGRLVQEDLCLIEASPEGPRLTAAVLCFPSRWRLREKLGRPLAAVHGAVPLYAERLARPVDRFMTHLKPGPVVIRLNWSMLDDAALFQPTGKWRTAHDATINAGNAGRRLFLRVERQSLRRLPDSGAVLFGIRVHVYRLDRAVADRDTAARLADAVRALPDSIAHYKSLPMFRDALLAWLDRRAAAPEPVAADPGWPIAG